MPVPTPCDFSRRPGMRNWAMRPTAYASAARAKTTHAVVPPVLTAQTSTARRVRSSPGRTGKTMPIIPTTMRSAQSAIVTPSDTRGSALVGGSGGAGRDEALRLVMDVSELTQRGDMLAGVVSTEEELATAVQGGPHVCLGPAPVTAVGSTQGSGGQQSVHVVNLCV